MSANENPLAQIAAAFGISVGAAYAFTTAVIALLSERAPDLRKALREGDPEFVLVDGILAECGWCIHGWMVPDSNHAWRVGCAPSGRSSMNTTARPRWAREQHT